MADNFPGPYIDDVPSNVDNPGPMIHRVKFSSTELGSRPSIMPKSIKNNMSVSHVGNQNSKGKGRG
jgi:hypothetical protein